VLCGALFVAANVAAAEDPIEFVPESVAPKITAVVPDT
jgi:hypothetical protein